MCRKMAVRLRVCRPHASDQFLEVIRLSHLRQSDTNARTTRQEASTYAYKDTLRHTCTYTQTHP